MIAAQEWTKNMPTSWLENGTKRIYCVTVNEIKQIQLDAIKEGMRRGAALDTLAKHTNASHEDVRQIADNILTAAEQLTVENL